MLLVLAAAGTGAGAGAATSRLEDSTTVAGIVVEVELAGIPASESAPATAGELVAEQPARLRLSLRDTAAATPLSGAQPAAWMGRRLGAGTPACGERVADYLSGSLLSRAAVDFNTYYILTLNHDATLSVVDPLFGYGGSRLLTLVSLASRGSDWVLMERDPSLPGRLYISQPETGQVAVLRTDTWRIERQLEVGPGVSRLLPQGDGAFVWALHANGVTLIDSRSGEIAASLPFEDSDQSPMAAIDMVLDQDDRHAYVVRRPAMAEGMSEVQVIDLRQRAILGRLPTGRGATSIAWSSLARSAWISHADGALVAVGMAKGRPDLRHRLAAGAPLDQIRFAPEGRLAFALSRQSNLLHIVDAARGRLIKSGPMAGEPDQVTFSSELAYVRHRGSELVLMVPLETAGNAHEPIQTADFPGGQRPYARRGVPMLAPSLARAPGANAVVIANPDDEAVYFYMEGMAAPMGEFSTQGRRPLAVRVVDRSLREGAPGIYETVVRLDEAGSYDLAVFLDAPRVIHCFGVTVEADPARPEASSPMIAKLVAGSVRGLRGGGVELDVELAGARLEAAPELVLLVQRLAGGWHQRIPATLVAPHGARYRARLRPAMPGEYLVWIESRAAGSNAAPLARLQVPATRPAP
ncbi:MAG: hypothetical protein AAF604_19880 [Acidobacteriota bacterium]